MSATLRQIQRLAENGDVRISLHGYEELADDEVLVRGLFCGGLLCRKGFARLWDCVLALPDRCEGIGRLAVGRFRAYGPKGGPPWSVQACFDGGSAGVRRALGLHCS